MLNRFQDVFRSLQEHDVKYVVIGGIASVIHGIPRATFDLDILIEATPENARRLLDALIGAGLGTALQTSAQEILDYEITVFQDRVRVDVQTSTPGIEFLEAWARRMTVSYQNSGIFVLSKQDLIQSKRSAGRDIDLEDVRLLKMQDQDSAPSRE